MTQGRDGCVCVCVCAWRGVLPGARSSFPMHGLAQGTGSCMMGTPAR
jgi:hypothetical protein